MKKHPRSYYERQDEKLRPLAEEIYARLPNAPGGIAPFVQAIQAELIKRGVDAGILHLVEQVKIIGNDELRIERVKSVPKKLTRKEYNDDVRFNAVRKLLADVVKAIANDDVTFFHKIHKAVAYRARGATFWLRVFNEWIVLRELLGRYPTQTELAKGLRSSGLTLDRKSIVKICRKHDIPLKRGNVGRPRSFLGVKDK